MSYNSNELGQHIPKDYDPPNKNYKATDTATRFAIDKTYLMATKEEPQAIIVSMMANMEPEAQPEETRPERHLALTA